MILVDRIPDNVAFGYSYRNEQHRFGHNSKVLPNATAAISNLKLIEKLSDNYQALLRANGILIQRRINAIIDEINLQTGTTEVLTDWITANRLNDLKNICFQ